MPRLHLLLLSLGVASVLAGCQLSLPGKGKLPDDVTPNAVTGDDIEVTALDAPLPAEADAALPTGADAGTKLQDAAPLAVADPDAETPPEPAPKPDLADPDAPDTDVPEAELPEPELAEPVPEIVKSEPQRACEKKKGRWIKTGSVLYACLFNTKDGGKSCTRGSQCDGDCLARSGTCSPIKPLFGCNEILQDDGARVTQCID